MSNDMNSFSRARRLLHLHIGSVLATGCLALSVVADTLTWKGGGSGLLSVASNWTSAASGAEATIGPQPGDTLKFTAAVTLEAETIDIGAAGLTIESNANINNHVTFTGAGGIVKKGTGDITQHGDAGGTFTGGVRFEGGRLVLKDRYLPNTTTAGRRYFGSGPIEFAYDTSSTYYIDFSDWDSGVTNTVVLSGRSTTSMANKGALYFHNNGSCGPVESANDFVVYQSYRTATLNGRVSAPGHTVTVYSFGSGTAYSLIDFKKEVDASVLKTGALTMQLSGVSTCSTNTLTISAGTNRIASAGYWGGTNIVVDGATAVLRLMGAANLSPAASVHVANGGKLDLDASCRVLVSELEINGTLLPDGTYGASDYPETIKGAGLISVAAVDKVWVGGATGLWSVGSNWQGGVAPVPGETVLFTNAVTLEAEVVNLGTDGFTIINTMTLVNHVTFTGAGGIVKRGAGIFGQAGDAGGTFTGGVRIEDGALKLQNRRRTEGKEDGYKYFGSGPVVLAPPSSFVNPYIHFADWNSGLTNAVNIQVNSPTNTFTVGNWASMSGPITATSDFGIRVTYATITFSKPFSAAGHTFTVNTLPGTDRYIPTVTMNAEVNASIHKIGAGLMNLAGISPEPTNTLALEGGTNTLAATAIWGGTNVVVSGAKTLLKLTANDNLSPDAVVTVANGGNIDIASGVKVSVSGLTIDGANKSSGIYTAANCPGTITGTGKLKVGVVGCTIIFR